MVWVGFDLTILTAVIVTVWSFVKKYPSTALFASSLATLLVVDTWFDVMTAHAGKERSQALLLAVVELGMAIFTYKLAYTALRALPAKD